jgi:hypothetical protein
LALFSPPGSHTADAIVPIVIDQISPWDLSGI